MSIADGPRLFTQEEVARRLNVTSRTVLKLRTSGKLKAVYPTRHPQYTEADLAAYIESLRTESKGSKECPPNTGSR